MAVVTITRFKIDPVDAAELRVRHAALVSAFRAAVPGPTEARLGRLHDDTWVGIWRWDSAEHLRTAQQKTPGLPEAAAAFALAAETTREDIEILDER